MQIAFALFLSYLRKNGTRFYANAICVTCVFFCAICVKTYYPKIYTCYSSSRIRDFDVQARNCLFEDERDEPNSQVTMFKHYSEENCLLECRAKHLMDKCGCLPYYYPRLDILLDFDQVLHEIKHWFGISVSSVGTLHR